MHLRGREPDTLADPNFPAYNLIIIPCSQTKATNTLVTNVLVTASLKFQAERSSQSLTH